MTHDQLERLQQQVKSFFDNMQKFGDEHRFLELEIQNSWKNLNQINHRLKEINPLLNAEQDTPTRWSLELEHQKLLHDQVVEKEKLVRMERELPEVAQRLLDARNNYQESYQRLSREITFAQQKSIDSVKFTPLRVASRNR
ncbi:MAG: hypothetical protein BGO90_10580 [Legionella sp. 40-6]|nr:hypothetical protein [Legionella sp.]OJY39417.1 MAG: hypothetical protein BGO90_10580 [Legionella sp. 40-6]